MHGLVLGEGQRLSSQWLQSWQHHAAGPTKNFFQVTFQMLLMNDSLFQAYMHWHWFCGKGDGGNSLRCLEVLEWPVSWLSRYSTLHLDREMNFLHEWGAAISGVDMPYLLMLSVRLEGSEQDNTWWSKHIVTWCLLKTSKAALVPFWLRRYIAEEPSS